MPDFTSYVPPGVYVQDTSQPVVTPTTVTTNTVTIIGPAVGYQTNTELVTVYQATTTALTKRGIFVSAVTGPPPISAPVVKNTAGVTMVYGTDYTFTVDASGTGGAANAVTYIQRLGPVGTPTDPSPNGLKDGDSVYVTYNYADTTYYTPQEFTDPSAISATYGAAVSGTTPTNPNATQVVCALTLAAQIAMANGASTIMCLPTNPADGTLKEQFAAAYAKIVTNYDAQLIVPLFVDGTPDDTGTPSDAHTADAVLALIQDVNTHCVSTSSDGFGRIAFVGFETNYDNATRNYDAVARQIVSKRTVLAYPNQMSFYNTRLAQTTVVAGYYLAAAMAGALAGGEVARGLTSVNITGFNGIPPALAQLQTRSFKDNLSKAGVSVVEATRAGALAVRHGLTTDMSALTTREVSLVRTGDILLELVQTGMEAAGLIGEPIDADMTTRVKGSLTGILERAVSDSVIRAYTNVAVRQQTLPSGDPSVIEAQFAYAPLVPLNYITVSFAIDLTSGEITDTTNTDETSTPTTG